MVFTGLIECTGKVSKIEQIDDSTENGGWSVTITAGEILDDCHHGDSIAVNGTCLTVVTFDTKSFKVGLAPETLSRTNLGQLKVGDSVNCERALKVGTRMGGHFVQGHVDTTTTIKQIDNDGSSIRFKFDIPPKRPQVSHIAPYIIPKGYITLDGASLTVTYVDLRDKTFGVMLIPYSQSKLTLTNKKVGDSVNVEVDMVGKYVENAVESMFETSEERKGDNNHIALDGFVERAVEKVLDRKGLTGKASRVLGR